jgi:glutamyl-tRNA reductase
MTARLLCLGVSSRGCGGLPAAPAASVELREDFRNALIAFAANGARISGLDERAILSTCHRVELYGCIGESQSTIDVLRLQIGHALAIDPNRLNEHVYSLTGTSAARHLCRVAAGLESIVLGEPEILGQVNAARVSAEQARTSGPVLAAVFQSAIRAGRRARTETAISTNPASLSSLALGLAESILGDLRERRALIVGVGEMGRGALKDLRKRGVTKLLFANRTRSTAESIAAQCGGTVFGFEELPAALRIADIVICATSACSPILAARVVRDAIANRPQKELVILDLAVPRNVEPVVATLPGARLFDVDDLQVRLDASLAERRREMPKVESIVEEELIALDREMRQRTVLPLIADLRQKAEAIRRREFERTLGFLRSADPQVIEHVQHLSHSLVNGLLHGPTVRLRELATDGVTADHAAAVRDLFGLES